MRSILLTALTVVGCTVACTAQPPAGEPSATTRSTTDSTGTTIMKTDDQWRAELSPDEYRILRQKGTERAFTGKYWDHHEDGTYTCRGCGAPLFTSEQKYDSGCGWPSYYDAIDSGAIVTRPDYSHGMTRTEIVCARCGGHLGHVFDDGPMPTGLRYCVNSASLGFEQAKPETDPTNEPEKP